MEIKKEVLPKSRVKLTVKVVSSEMRRVFDRVYNKLVPQVEVKGFRPGAAPQAMIIEAVGEQRMQSLIIEDALQETYPQVLKKEELIPVASPKINIKMVKDLTNDNAEMEYEAEVDVFPQIQMGDYKKIKVKKEKVEDKATQEEIDQVLSHLARQQAQFKDVDRPLKEGDRAEINFEAFDKGVRLDNLSSKNYPVILGGKVLIPEFEEKLIGAKKGDKKEFTLEVAPQPNQPKKKIDFKVEVIQAQEVILPKMDDEFAKKYQKETFSDLKKAITEDIVKQKKEMAERNLENQILEALLKLVKVDLPQSLVDQEVDREVNDIRSRTAMMGITFEQYLGNMKKTPEEYRESLTPQAEKTIKIGLALGEVVKKEKIDPKDKEAGKLALEKIMASATK